jgi:hypothetical protein
MPTLLNMADTADAPRLLVSYFPTMSQPNSKLLTLDSLRPPPLKTYSKRVNRTLSEPHPKRRRVEGSLANTSLDSFSQRRVLQKIESPALNKLPITPTSPLKTRRNSLSTSLQPSLLTDQENLSSQASCQFISKSPTEPRIRRRRVEGLPVTKTALPRSEK